MIAFKLESFSTLPSTQDEMRRRLLAGDAVHGLVVQAAQQTAARGQRARDWHATYGGSYQTLAVRLQGAPPPYAALVFALGLAEVMPVYGVQVGIKWPNDLFYRGKKLAGLLVEHLQGHLLIGVGLNVNNEVPEGAVGLRGWDVQGAHMVVLEGLERGLAHLEDAAFCLERAYAPFDLLLDCYVEMLTVNGLETGVAAGVDASGQLLLQQGETVTAYTGRLQNLFAAVTASLVCFILKNEPMSLLSNH